MMEVIEMVRYDDYIFKDLRGLLTSPVASAIVSKKDDHVIAKVWDENHERWKRIARGKSGEEDAEVIQNALEDVGGIVFIGKGTYYMKTELTVDGKEVTLVSNGAKIHAESGIHFWVKNSGKLRVFNLEYFGDPDADNYNGIAAENSTLEIYNSYIHDIYGPGVYVRYGELIAVGNKFYNCGLVYKSGHDAILTEESFVYIERNKIDTTAEHGIYLSHKPDGEGSYGYVVKNVIKNTAYDGIKCRGKWFVVAKNKLENPDSGERAIRILGASEEAIVQKNEIDGFLTGIQIYKDSDIAIKSVIISNNVVRNVREVTGIDVYDNLDADALVIIANNETYNTGRQGIAVKHPSLVIGNIIDKYGQYVNQCGIEIVANNCIVTKNIVLDGTQEGIREYSGYDYNIIEGNYAKNGYTISGEHTYCDEFTYESLPTDGFAVKNKPVLYYDGTNYYLAVWDGSTWRKVQLT